MKRYKDLNKITKLGVEKIMCDSGFKFTTYHKGQKRLRGMVNQEGIGFILDELIVDGL